VRLRFSRSSIAGGSTAIVGRRWNHGSDARVPPRCSARCDRCRSPGSTVSTRRKLRPRVLCDSWRRLEDGETSEEAAKREAGEELGAKHVTVQELWTGQTEFSIGTRRSSRRRPSSWFTDVPSSRERRSSRFIGGGHQRDKMVSFGEIESTEDLVFPSDLVAS